MLTSSKTGSHTGAVAGAVVGTLGAILIVIGVVTFVRRRRRLDKRKSIGSSISSSLIEAGAQVTPYYIAPPEVTQRDLGSWMTGPQPQSEPLEAETVPDIHSSSSHSLPLPPAVVPAPVGLSSKELAQLRTDVLVRSQNNLPLPPAVVPAPVGLSSKELAQLRTDALVRSQNNLASSGSSSSQPNPALPVTTIRRTATAVTSSNTRQLQSEVEDLRREMQLLRAERFEAPPSYAEEVA